MDCGLTVFGDTNKIQIDQDYQNLQFRAKGSVVTDTAASIGQSLKSFTITGINYPLIAFRCPTAGTGVLLNYCQDNGGGSYTFFIRTLGGVGTQVDYWLFDVGVAGTGPNVGMQVFNAGSALVYDTRQLPMKVVSFITPHAAGPNSQVDPSTGVPYTVPYNHQYAGVSGRIYACVQSKMPYMFVGGGSPGSFFHNILTGTMGLLNSDGSAGISMSYMQVASVGGSPASFNDPGSYLVLDVTYT